MLVGATLDADAQYRRKDISTFSGIDRHRLRELIIQWLTFHPLTDPLNPVQQHLDVIGPLPGGVHCKTGTFLTWHRQYIEQLEAWLMGQPDGPRFVPLPKWSPITPIPDEFYNNLIAPGHAVASFGVTTFPPLGEQDPNSLGGYDFSRFGNPSTVCNYVAGNETRWCMGTPSTFISFGSAFDNFAADLEWEHDPVHMNIGGVMGFGQSPAAAIFWPWHSYVDDLYQYYLCQCTASYPQTDLYIKDNNEDIGDQPNTTTTVFWTSPEIWVRQNQDVFSGGRYSLQDDLNRHENAEYKTTGNNYVYVRVRNKGCLATTATDVRLRVYWSKAQTAGWSWPGDWTNTPPAIPKRGDEITNPSVPLYVPALQPGETWVAEVPWQAPNPADYPTDSYHFCLVARLQSTVDPMTPAGEGTDIGLNARNQNNIAWKNVTVLDSDPFNIAPPPANQPWNTLKVRSLNNRPLADTRIQFDFPANHGLTALVELRDELYDVWAAGGYAGRGITPIEGTKQLRVDSSGAYIGGLTLVPRMIYTIGVRPSVHYGQEYQGVILKYGDRLNFNVSHYEQPTTGGGHRLVGGNNYELRITQSDQTTCGELIHNAELVRPRCPNANDGAIRLHLEPGLYEFFWSNGGRSNAIENVAPGTYWVVVRSRDNCVERREFVLENASGLRADITSTVPRCRAENGSLYVNAHGGRPPYRYQWYRDGEPIQGATNPSLQGVGFGMYTVVVADTAGCEVTDGVIFGDDFMQFRLAFQVVDASSPHSADGAINLTPVDGMGPFTYRWSNGATTEDLSNLPPGDYSVIVVDHMGCVANGTVVVGVIQNNNLQSVDSPNADLTVLSVVPNPVKDLAEIQYTLRYSTPVRVEVYDDLGRLATSYEQGVKPVGVNSAWIETSGLASGRYSCRLVFRGGVTAVPFVVVR